MLIHKLDHHPFCVDHGSSIRDVLVSINRNSGSPCVITDASNASLAVVTDGDVRRFLLSGGSLDEPVTRILTDFYSVSEGTSRTDAEMEMISRGIDFLPIVDPEGKIRGVWSGKKSGSPEILPYPVLVLAGGKGSRLQPLTFSVPKPLIRVGDVTLLDRTLSKCTRDGYRNFYLSVNYLKDQLVDHLRGANSPEFQVRFVEENTPLGTAGPIGLLPPEAQGPLLVVNADVIHNVDLAKMMKKHEDTKADMTVAVRIHQTTIPFGVVDLDGSRILRVKEKPTFNFPVNAGIYIVSPSVRDMVEPGVALDMPDLISQTISQGLLVESFLVHEYWLDVGTHESLALAESEVEKWHLG